MVIHRGHLGINHSLTSHKWRSRICRAMCRTLSVTNFTQVVKLDFYVALCAEHCHYSNHESQTMIRIVPIRKIPAPIKIKSALPRPKNPKSPLNENLWAWRVSCRKNAKIPGAHKTGAAISGPRIAGKTLYGHEVFFSEPRQSGPGNT